MPSSRCLSSLLILAGLSGCDTPASPNPGPPPPDMARAPIAKINPDVRIVAVGDEAPLESLVPCAAPLWTVDPPAGGARFINPKDNQTRFVSSQPGHFTVRLTCGKGSDTLGLLVFQPTLEALASDPVFLPVGCYDAVASDSGRLLCTNAGITVFDAQGGETLSHTAEDSPYGWGITTSRDLVATASTSGPGDSRSQLPGVWFYRLDEHDKLQLLSQRPAAEPSYGIDLDGDRLLVRQHDIRVYDVKDPASPSLLGCAPASPFMGDSDALYPRMLVLDGKVFIWTIYYVIEYSIDSIVRGGCGANSAAPTVSFKRQVGQGSLRNFVGWGHYLFALHDEDRLPGPHDVPQCEIHVLDVSDLSLAKQVGSIEGLVCGNDEPIGVYDGGLYVAQKDALLIFDLTVPENPRPAARWKGNLGRLVKAPGALWVLSVNKDRYGSPISTDLRTVTTRPLPAH